MRMDSEQPSCKQMKRHNQSNNQTNKQDVNGPFVTLVESFVVDIPYSPFTPLARNRSISLYIQPSYFTFLLSF